MRRLIFAVACTTVCLVNTPQAIEAQDAERQLQQVTELSIKPSLIGQFEAANALRNKRMAAAGVTFVSRGSVSESLIYRFVTPVGDLDGMQELSGQMGELGPPAAGGPNGNEAIDHIDSYLRVTRPGLSYAPDNPRLAVNEWEAIRRFRIFVQQGKMGEMADVMRDLAALYAEQGIRDSFQVSVQQLGPDAPVMEIQVFGSSMADVYEAGERGEAQMGAQMDELRGRIGAVARRIEVDNFTIRRDLGYQPGN